MKEKVSLTIERKVLKEVEELVDGLRIRNTSQAVEYLLKKALGEEKTVVILCGGPENKYKINGKYRFVTKLDGFTVIEETVKKLKRYGFKHIYVIARENVLMEIFRILEDGRRYGVKVEYVKETLSKGTMDSLRSLKGRIDTNFLVVFGDVVFDIDLNKLWEAHIKNGGTATLTLESYDKPGEKGVVRLEGNQVVEFVQKPKNFKSHIVFVPIFFVGPEIFEYSGNSLEENVFPQLASEGLLFGYITSGWNKHVHTKKDVEEIKKLLKLKK
ncbi:MAG: hypothetical protein J7K87_01700 [Candidatus Aenigmarchaeota archaeon]|nr:hypothetical protein [Candidatus Aenigmarchaeota archaeon]